MAKDKCNIVHGLSGVICIRTKDHSGLCWGKAQPNSSGSITRCKWHSKNGKFYSHSEYETIYPANKKQ